MPRHVLCRMTTPGSTTRNGTWLGLTALTMLDKCEIKVEVNHD